MVSTDRSLARSHARSTWTKAVAGTVTVALVLALGVSTAAAWSANPSGSFKCVVTDAGFRVGLDWTVTSWQPGTLEGENPEVVVEMGLNGGSPEVIAVGAFTAENGGQFGGSVVLPDGTATVQLISYGAAPWGDGTVDQNRSSVWLDVPTLAAIGDPACLGDEAPSVDHKTPTPAPTPTPEAQPTPTPEPQPTPTVESTPTPQPQPTESVVEQPTPEPTAEVQGRTLARTGNETPAVAFAGVFLVIFGGLAYAGSRMATRSE